MSRIKVHLVLCGEGVFDENGDYQEKTVCGLPSTGKFYITPDVCYVDCKNCNRVVDSWGKGKPEIELPF